MLAGANRKGKDSPETFAADGGIVLAEDILSLNLHKLAVLSACETGLGDVAGGEGVFGLQRAFHVAGTRNVIASLWKVDDEATTALMTLFYQQLWQEKQPPLEALRQAQLYLYHHPDEIPKLVKERGPKKDVVSKIPTEPPKEKDLKDGRPVGKAAVKQWAAFVLSGTGR